MANIDIKHLDSLMTRFKAYKSPNDAQRLIVALGEKKERSVDDDKKLAVLMKAEKKAAELMKARAATNLIINAEKTEARKLETRKKIIWGAALLKASENDPEVGQVLCKLFNHRYISDRDKDAVKADFDAIQTLHTSNKIEGGTDYEAIE